MLIQWGSDMRMRQAWGQDMSLGAGAPVAMCLGGCRVGSASF